MEIFIDYVLLGRRIKERRKKLKITQEQLATQMNISTAYMSQLETGKAPINLNRLAQFRFYCKRISTIFHRSVHYLIEKFNSILSDRTSQQLSLAYRLLK